MKYLLILISLVYADVTEDILIYLQSNVNAPEKAIVHFEKLLADTGDVKTYFAILDLLQKRLESFDNVMINDVNRAALNGKIRYFCYLLKRNHSSNWYSGPEIYVDNESLKTESVAFALFSYDALAAVVTAYFSKGAKWDFIKKNKIGYGALAGLHLYFVLQHIDSYRKINWMNGSYGSTCNPNFSL